MSQQQSNASGAAAPMVPSHIDVTVQLPGDRSGVFRVRQLTPFDFASCAEPYSVMVGRINAGGTFGEIGAACFVHALLCVAATAEPLDDEARRAGVKGVVDPASLRRLALAFIELNLTRPGALREMGKFLGGFTELLKRAFGGNGELSSTPSTSSSATATPSTPPSESPLSISPA